MRASNNRTNPRYSGDSIQRSWTSLLAERMQWTAARKSTALKTGLGTKTEVSHAEGAVVGRSRIERDPDLGILPTTEKQPAMEYRNEALVVGYLGFRAKICLGGCTISDSRAIPIRKSNLPFRAFAFPVYYRKRPLMANVLQFFVCLAISMLPRVFR